MKTERQLIANGGLFKHNCGMSPFYSSDFELIESYQLLRDGVSIADITIYNGFVKSGGYSNDLNYMEHLSLTSWINQLKEDYKKRGVKLLK